MALCVLRVMLCWTRYIFYDMQVEFVDMALQHSDELFVSCGDVVATSPVLAMFVVILDIGLSVIQMLLSLFKLGIAAFLLWLVLDLFILRPCARSYMAWLSWVNSK